MRIIEELRRKYRCALRILLIISEMRRSTFYEVKSRLGREDKDKALRELIGEIYHHHHGRYGYRRITLTLRKRHQLAVNHKKVYRIMKEEGLAARIRRKK